MFSFINKVSANYTQLAHDFQFKEIDGGVIKLSEYKNKVIVVVNVASRCGFTNQYDDLQNLWTNYKDNDLIVIGVPTNDFKQEPGSNKDIKDYPEKLNEVIEVSGAEIVDYTVHLTWEHCSLIEILEIVIPKDVTIPKGYE